MRIAPGDHLVVTSPGVDDLRPRRMTTADVMELGAHPCCLAHAMVSTHIMALRGTSNAASRPVRVNCPCNRPHPWTGFADTLSGHTRSLARGAAGETEGPSVVRR